MVAVFAFPCSSREAVSYITVQLRCQSHPRWLPLSCGLGRPEIQRSISRARGGCGWRVVLSELVLRLLTGWTRAADGREFGREPFSFCYLSLIFPAPISSRRPWSDSRGPGRSVLVKDPSARILSFHVPRKEFQAPETASFNLQSAHLPSPAEGGPIGREGEGRPECG